MKNLKLLLFNNFISLLVLVANNILGFILFILIFILADIENVPAIIEYILHPTLIFILIGITPCLFCFFVGKKFYKKVNRVFCFVSPIAFFICSLCFDIFTYVKEMLKFIPENLLSGDSFYLYFLIRPGEVSSHLESYYFFMMSIATTILYYLILVIGNLYQQDDKPNKTGDSSMFY